MLEGQFRLASDSPSFDLLLDRLAKLHVKYLIRQQKADGSLYLRYEPFQNRLYEGISAPRLAHGAWVLARAYKAFGGSELEDACEKIIDCLLRRVREGEHGYWLEEADDSPSVSETSFLLLALCQFAEDDSRRALASELSSTLWSTINAHGCIRTHRPPTEVSDAFQDYFPGQMLLALGAAYQAGVTGLQESKLDSAFKYYRHRFRYRRDFGQVSWLMQSFGTWWKATGNLVFADLVFEIGDWILQYQQEKTGAFINDHQSDTPGYTTALYLEGIAVGVKLAASLNNDERHRRYLESLTRGFKFLDRLVIQQRDSSLLPNAEFAIGGLRQSLYSSEIRVDFVQHSLSAILEAYSG